MLVILKTLLMKQSCELHKLNLYNMVQDGIHQALCSASR
jgi:hypothetical protein